MNGYRRNGNPESSRWKTNADEFRGYVRAKLEDLDETQKDQWKEHISARKRLTDIEKNAQYQLGGISILYIIAGLFLAAVAAGLIHLGGI